MEAHIEINRKQLALYEEEYKKLRAIDYHIEGCIGKVLPPEVHEEYLSGKHGYGVCIMHRIAPLKIGRRMLEKNILL